MKKTLILLILISLSFSCSLIYASSVDYDLTSGGITYIDNKLILNNYIHNEGDYSTLIDDVDYSIYSSDDLVIELIGDNKIYGEGIRVDGNLSIIGSGSLIIDYLEVNGEEFTTTVDISLKEGTYSYYGPKLNRPMVVNYIDNEGNSRMAQYNNGFGSYFDYLDNNSVNNLKVIANTSLANIDNLYIDSPVYKRNNYTGNVDIELINNNGFIVYDPSIRTDVSYEPSTLTYTVTFYDDFNNEDDIKIHYYELAYELGEWGKDVSYKVLEAENAYEYSLNDGMPSFNDFIINAIYYEKDGYVGERTRYAKEINGIEDIGTAFYCFGVKKNNYLSMEIIGKDGTHRYINLRVKEKPKDNDFVIPNTGVRY